MTGSFATRTYIVIWCGGKCFPFVPWELALRWYFPRRARKIHVAGQRIAEDKSDQHVTSRNLTLKELLSQLGHHSDKVRKDAVSGRFHSIHLPRSVTVLHC